ncbi:tannase [Oenococcus sp. UCMA 16435]|nr:tannase [Oenococcus sp. UCMA 16435]
MNVFVPLGYYKNESINDYGLNTAPIFMPNTVGGYFPGPRTFPGDKKILYNSSTIVKALSRGYVVVSAGLRGRTLTNENGEFIGKAPAFIVDMKAAIRYIKLNKDNFPGDVNKIITNGTSAGGAISALAGASGNTSFFEKELEEIGAASSSDNIFAVSAYCPIHNLEHADAAYEWQFNGINDWHTQKIEIKNGKAEFSPLNGQLNELEKQLSSKLKDQFIEYLNSLRLRNPDGDSLTLDNNGEGSFLELTKKFLIKSAQTEVDKGNELDNPDFLDLQNNQVVGLKWKAYLRYLTRMKRVPAFDDLGLNNPENDLFGDLKIKAKHFTEIGQSYGDQAAKKANPELVAAVNPLSYLNNQANSLIAKHWRIRHGAADRDTSFAIPIILATTLQNMNYDVDFFMPWAKPHSGDYDLIDLFDWIDSLVKGK